jgi:transposase-like protein
MFSASEKSQVMAVRDIEAEDLIISGGTTSGYAASHVSKRTWWQMHRTTPIRWTQKLSENNPILVVNRKAGAHLSGVLCLDEIHYRVNGKKVCGLAAIDPNGNWLVHLKQVKGRDKERIESFSRR